MWKWLYGSNLVQKVDRLGTYAAALAYCFVLSLVPFLVVTFTFGSFVAPTLDWSRPFQTLLSEIFPTGSLQPSQVVSAVRTTSHHGLATIGFVLALYTSYTLMTQIVRTLVFIFDDTRAGREWNWTMAAKTLGLVAIWMTLLLVISACTVSQFGFRHRLHHGAAEWWDYAAVDALDLMMIVALFGAFFLTYLLVPARRYRRESVRDGAIVASAGWIICSLVFSHILPKLWQFNTVYEALGSFVVVLIWAQACAWSVIAGAAWIVRFSPRRKT
jgi:YihY family inner membrane protein